MGAMPSDYPTIDLHDDPLPSGSPTRWFVWIRTEIGKTLRGGSAFLFGTLMLANIVAFAYHMLMARVLLPADYGVVVTLTSVSYLLDVLMRTIQVAVTKAVAMTREARDEHARAVLLVAMRSLVPVASVAFVGLWLTSQWIADFFHVGTPTPVILLGLYASSHMLLPVPRGILLGLNRLHSAGVTILLEPVARLVGGMTLVALGLGINGAMTGFAVGNFLALAIGLMLLWPNSRTGNALQAGAFDGFDRYAFLVLLINACLMVMASVDQIIVEHFFPADVGGNYAIAFVLGRVILMSSISLGTVVFTRSATMKSDHPGSPHLLAKGLVVVGAAGVIATIGFLTVPAVIVRLVAGSQYRIAQAYIGLMGLEMTLFGLVYVQAYYHISLKKMLVVWPLCLATALEITLLAIFHDSVQQILMILISIMGILLVSVSGLSWRILQAYSRQKPAIPAHSHPAAPTPHRNG